jgi:hypothetical protein
MSDIIQGDSPGCSGRKNMSERIRPTLSNAERRWRYKEARNAGASKTRAKRMRDLRVKYFLINMDYLEKEQKRSAFKSHAMT